MPRFSGCAKLACFLHVSRDLFSQSFHAFKFLLGAKKLHEFDFDISAINVAMEIEQMNFDHALGLFAGNSGSESDIDDTVMQHAFKPRLDKINAVGRKLFAVRAEIRGGKTKLTAQLRSFSDRTQNGVVAAEHCGCTREIAPLNPGANGSTADHRPVHFHRRNADNIKMVPHPELAQKREIAGAIFPERPFVTNTNLAQRSRALGQLRDKILRLGLCEVLVERNDQEMADSLCADERNLMRCRGDEMRRIFRTQNLGRMRIEGNHNRCSIPGMGMSSGSRYDCLMPKVDAVEGADGEEKRTGQLREIGSGMQDFHQEQETGVSLRAVGSTSRKPDCRLLIPNDE